MVVSDVKLPIELPPEWAPPTDKKKIILATMNTDDARLTQDAMTLRAWVNMQPHLPFLPESELYMIKSYLLQSKNSMEKAKNGLDTYFTARSAHYDLFGSYNVNEKELKQYSKYMHVAMCKDLTPDLHRVLVARLTPAEQTEEDFRGMCRINLIKVDVLMRLDYNLGVELILDLSNFSTNHAKVLAMCLTTMKNFLTCTMGAIPTRVKHLHIVNAPSVFTSSFGLVQAMMKDKLKRRILMHSSMKSLSSYVPPSSLPKDLGGDLPTIHELEVILQSHFATMSSFYAYQRTLQTDESKRAGGPSKLHGSFGCEGSFRKLALD